VGRVLACVTPSLLPVPEQYIQPIRFVSTLQVKSERRTIEEIFATFTQHYKNTTYIIEKSTQINTIAPLTISCVNLNKTQECSFLYQKRVHHCKQVCNTIGGQAMDDFRKYLLSKQIVSKKLGIR